MLVLNDKLQHGFRVIAAYLLTLQQQSLRHGNYDALGTLLSAHTK